MAGQRIGYTRISTEDQNSARQLVDEKLDRVFAEQASGKNVKDRPVLAELIAYARDGDEVVVSSMDRLARNLAELQQLVSNFTAAGISVTFIQEHLVFAPGKENPMNELLLGILGSVAAFERAQIRDRAAAGIALAKARGVYKGRKPSLDETQATELVARATAGEPKAAIARSLGVSRETVYAYLKRASLASGAQAQSAAVPA